MTQALLVSQVLLWLVVAALALAVLALARQVGVLHERVAPAGALVTGRSPRVGEAAPVLHGTDLQGRSLHLGGPHPGGKSVLLLFVSPRCPVCKKLLPAVKALGKQERHQLEVILVSDGEAREEHADFVREQGLQEFPYVLSSEIGMAFQVGRLPYSVLLDEKGVVRAHGLVNTREHLESLLMAKESGYGSIQEYLRARNYRHGENQAAETVSKA